MNTDGIVSAAEKVVANKKYWGTYWYCYTGSFRSSLTDVVDAVKLLDNKYLSFLFLHSRFLWWRWVRVVDKKWSYLLDAEIDC